MEQRSGSLGNGNSRRVRYEKWKQLIIKPRNCVMGKRIDRAAVMHEAVGMISSANLQGNAQASMGLGLWS